MGSSSGRLEGGSKGEARVSLPLFLLLLWAVSLAVAASLLCFMLLLDASSFHSPSFCHTGPILCSNKIPSSLYASCSGGSVNTCQYAKLRIFCRYLYNVIIKKYINHSQLTHHAKKAVGWLDLAQEPYFAISCSSPRGGGVVAQLLTSGLPLGPPSHNATPVYLVPYLTF